MPETKENPSLATDKATDAPPPPQPEAQKYVMPSLEKGPASFYDTETKAFWVGIPVEKTDFLMASVLLDRIKFDLLVLFQQEAINAQNRSKIIKPWHEKARENGKALLQKLKLH